MAAPEMNGRLHLTDVYQNSAALTFYFWTLGTGDGLGSIILMK